MSYPIILSDEEDPIEFSTPFTAPCKKFRRIEPHFDKNPAPSILILDDDPTPQKHANASTPTPSFVSETPMSSGFACSEVAIVKCTRTSSDANARVSATNRDLSGISGLICLESDNESEEVHKSQNSKENEGKDSACDASTDLVADRCVSPENGMRTELSWDSYSNPTSSMVCDYVDGKNVSLQRVENHFKKQNADNGNNKTNATKDGNGKRKVTKEERLRLMEEKKLLKEQEKLRKAAVKAEAAEQKNIEKEKQKWEKGKFALKAIVAEIDAKVVESGSIGGHLLTRFAEKGMRYRIASNPIERSIVWSMTVPEHISQFSTQGVQIPYILLVYEAKEFCDLVLKDSIFDLVSNVQSQYPCYTVCYLTNRLMAYINKREQETYKNPTNTCSWKRPAVEEVLAKLATHFSKVHSRQCIDEAELAEHVVGLTSSLASCLHRKKLTRLSINANGFLVPKDAVDRNLIKKNLWLKALIAIPKVQPRFAIAIWKKYPTMKSLLSVYMDPNKSVHEKEFLLRDLTTEGLLGDDRRLGEVCSKRVYRILMAQNASITTDEVENGADFFRKQTSQTSQTSSVIL